MGHHSALRICSETSGGKVRAAGGPRRALQARPGARRHKQLFRGSIRWREIVTAKLALHEEAELEVSDGHAPKDRDHPHKGKYEEKKDAEPLLVAPHAEVPRPAKAPGENLRAPLRRPQPTPRTWSNTAREKSARGGTEWGSGQARGGGA